MKKLHPTQQKLIELLKKQLDEPLTIRQLQVELNLSTTSLVHHHILQLEKKGYLKRNPSNPSDYQIIEDTEKKIIYLNLYGLAECGPSGRLLDGNPIDRIPISTKMFGFPARSAFLVKAKGDSMTPKIYDGDLVIAQKNNEIKDGVIIVCVNKGMALIKKLVKTNNNIMLHSFNENYKPFEADINSFRVEGHVKSIMSFNI